MSSFKPFVVPVPVLGVLSGFSAFGVSGSRSCAVASGLAGSLVRCLPVGVSVLVGCAAGVDSAARSVSVARGLALYVFSVSAFPASTFAASLALRSSACVRACVSASGLWCSFPSGSCPGIIRPSSSWVSGSGSGSWASLALAVGLGSACLVCLPSGIPAPRWFAAAGFVCLAGSWFYRAAQSAPAPQLSLF